MEYLQIMLFHNCSSHLRFGGSILDLHVPLKGTSEAEIEAAVASAHFSSWRIICFCYAVFNI